MTTGSAETFFEGLGQRAREPALAKVSGRVRFDLVDGAHTDAWLVEVDHGDLRVERSAGAGDCTVRGDRTLFDELVTGHANAMAAVLRGALECTGDIELLMAIQRIFPGPPRGWRPDLAERSPG